MGYKVNPSAWGAIFPVPSQIVDKHIRLAGATQLKALLWLLRHASEDVGTEEISAAIGQKPADTVDALQYWVENGIIAMDNSAVVAPVKEQENTVNRVIQLNEDTNNEPAVKVTNAHQTPLAPLPVATPTYEQILARAKESSEIKFLFNEAQQKLGRTIGYEGQCALLMIHDQYGLPVEVILMILEYAVSINKISYSYISSIGRDWGEKEIDTIDKADVQITNLRTVNTLWKQFAAMAGLTNPRPTATQIPYIKSWGTDMGFNAEMIYLAYEQMANHCQKLSLAYIDKVLKTWYNAGIKTPEDVEKAGKERQEQKRKGKAGTNSEASYGLDDFKHSAMHDSIVYEKRAKK